MLLIQFTLSASGIQGTADESYLSGDGRSVETGHYGVSGNISGTNLILSINGRDLSGSLDTEALRLNVPDKTTGAIRTIAFRHGSTADYNRGVAALHATADKNAGPAAQAQAAADAESQLAAASDAVSTDVSKLKQILAKGVDLGPRYFRN